ncbi:hypothetical protein OFN60_40905, partial [Escherichia coli]|nr:hypothetical protein [Escherichia coli]
SLAITYNTTEEAILKANRMISPDLGFYPHLYKLIIPKKDCDLSSLGEPANTEEERRRNALHAFQKVPNVHIIC